MKTVMVILAAPLVAGCGYGSAPAGPSAPNFVVVSTDWRGTLVQPARPDPRLPGLPQAPVYQYTAHGIFRNQGSAGSAIVTFQDWHGESVSHSVTYSPGPDTCKVVIKASAGELVEATCSMGFSDTYGTNKPPTATVSQ